MQCHFRTVLSLTYMPVVKIVESKSNDSSSIQCAIHWITNLNNTVSIDCNLACTLNATAVFPHDFRNAQRFLMIVRATNSSTLSLMLDFVNSIRCPFRPTDSLQKRDIFGQPPNDPNDCTRRQRRSVLYHNQCFRYPTVSHYESIMKSRKRVY